MKKNIIYAAICLVACTRCLLGAPVEDGCMPESWLGAEDRLYAEPLYRMIFCCDGVHNEAKKAEYTRLLLQKAEECKEETMLPGDLFGMGEMLYYQGSKDKGYEYMQQAVEMMKGEAGQYDRLYDCYVRLVELQEEDRRNEAALHTLGELEKAVRKRNGSEVPTEGREGKKGREICAHYAIVLYRLGKAEEAETYYRQFVRSGGKECCENALIVPYLFDRKRYREVIRIHSAHERFHQEQEDTVSYHMAAIRKMLGQAYREVGDYRAAAHYFERLAVLQDSLRGRERWSALPAWGITYEMHRKDALIRSQAASLRRKDVGLIYVGCGLLLSFVMWRRKQAYDVVWGLYPRKNRPKGALPPVPATSVAEEIKPVAAGQSKKAKGNAIKDQLLFDKMVHEIVSRQLFLQSGFSREELIKIVYVPKNKFARLFETYAGMKFSDYINHLRLRHAIKLLEERPGYTIDTIAQECGMTSPTFYRLFLTKFGASPTEFQRNSQQTNGKSVSE